MIPKISEEIGLKFRTNEIPISPHKGVLSCFFNHSFYTTIYDIQSITVKQQPHNEPVLNILMQSVSTPNNPKTYDSGPCFRGRALHDTSTSLEPCERYGTCGIWGQQECGQAASTSRLGWRTLLRSGSPNYTEHRSHRHGQAESTVEESGDGNEDGCSYRGGGGVLEE